MRRRVVAVVFVALAACSKRTDDGARGAAVPAGPPPDAAAPYVEGGPCPESFMLPETGEARCVCRPDRPQGYAWGTGQYAPGSDLCLAARHAGAIDEGGTIRVARTRGCLEYLPSYRNDVSSSSFRADRWSIYFPGFTSAECTQVIDPRAADSRGWCPSVLPLAADGVAPTLTCMCAPPIAAGPVWGTGPYALDSSPCAAAVHAGVIDESGGRVTIEHVEGCARYAAGIGHGVAARASDATPAAFRFAGSTATCATAAP